MVPWVQSWFTPIGEYAFGPVATQLSLLRVFNVPGTIVDSRQHPGERIPG